MAKSRFTKTRPTLAQLQAQFRAGMPHDQDPAKLPAFMLETPRAPRKASVRKHEEHDSQSEIVTYLKRFCPEVLISSSCNGELWPMSQHVDKGRFFGWMNKLKSRGLLTGDPDLRLTWHPSRCIFIEKKREKGGVTSDAQETVGSILKKQGFTVYVMSGGIEALREIIKTENIPCLENIQ